MEPKNMCQKWNITQRAQKNQTSTVENMKRKFSKNETSPKNEHSNMKHSQTNVSRNGTLLLRDIFFFLLFLHCAFADRCLVAARHLGNTEIAHKFCIQ